MDTPNDRMDNQSNRLCIETEDTVLLDEIDRYLESNETLQRDDDPRTQLYSVGEDTVLLDKRDPDLDGQMAQQQDGSDAPDSVSESFLEYFLSFPLIKNLKEASLLSDREIIKAACTWRQMGGKLERVLVDRIGIKSSTLAFFSNGDAGSVAKQKGCRRIGEFLRAAGLVSEDEIQFVLQELDRQSRSLKLGDALVEQGLIKQSTVDYFADQFILKDRGLLDETGDEIRAQLSDRELDVDSQFQQEEFLLVIRQNEQFSSHTLRTRMYSIGREKGNDIVIDDPFISRRHAYLIRSQEEGTQQTTYEVLDCGKRNKYSTNGIFVNGKKIKHHALKYGDLINLGPKTQARFLPIEGV